MSGKNKVIEVIDKYEPDFLWFDVGLDIVHEKYKQDLLAYYYQQGDRSAESRCGHL